MISGFVPQKAALISTSNMVLFESFIQLKVSVPLCLFNVIFVHSRRHSFWFMFERNSSMGTPLKPPLYCAGTE